MFRPNREQPDIEEALILAERGREAEVIAFPTGARPTQVPPAGPEAPATQVTEVPADADAETALGEIVDDGEVLKGEVVRVDRDVDAFVAQRGDWLADLAERKKSARPIVPAYLRTREEAAQTAKWVADYYAHVLAYQATRAPLYLLRLLGRSPRGAGRALTAWGRWVADAESKPLRQAAAQRGSTGEYMVLSRERNVRVRTRATLSAGTAAVVLVTALIAAPTTPGWGPWVAVWALLTTLGAFGGKKDVPLINRAVLPAKVTKLDSDAVLRALGSLGIAEINKALGPKGSGITFTAPITRDGPGWRAELDLPYGVTASAVAEKRKELASGLRRNLGCVWPEAETEEHPGRLVLWVGDLPMNKAKPAPWPLLKTGKASIFEPLPYGVDQRGRPVAIQLMFANLLIGAIPRMGKTFGLRVLLLAAALDVLVELRIFELKGTGDLSMLRQVCHDYGQGFSDPVLERALLSLREVRKELLRRADVIANLPRDICPENKVTPELAAKKTLGLHPILIGIDECQMLFEHKQYGEEAGAIAEEIIRLGPALGIILVVATQRPDKDAIPTGVASNVGLRMCFKVTGQVENDMVLGTSSYKNGLRATTFTMSDKGIAYAVGVADEPIICRSAFVDGPDAEKVADRARQLREASGRITGVAAGEAPTVDEAPAANLLDDVLAAWPTGETEAWWTVLVDRLAELRPEEYGAWAEVTDARRKATPLSNAMKSQYGIEGRQINRLINGKETNRRGVDLDTITNAIAERD
ncbi:S-DNA-T family DNA segregation ATPase FtsK/SpoIIIE [Spinactinospora alkalitolerans]|uniref:S-DNA-T family DNA segregation ATPase FtsK/SpoIIIE n=1 Tax=Spinactinospora alkalitolerans TaxID=687207 RepID=A0A852U089_9ACTN|nr:cell division protein FtsK [Spinactinospora alkalitolerans]NYE49608.1 S-DNA-T family DNA segregation ATPase FtsK/SpoIIIE [Spinactinospora alkalitolerans]